MYVTIYPLSTEISTHHLPLTKGRQLVGGLELLSQAVGGRSGIISHRHLIHVGSNSACILSLILRTPYIARVKVKGYLVSGDVRQVPPYFLSLRSALYGRGHYHQSVQGSGQGSNNMTRPISGWTF